MDFVVEWLAEVVDSIDMDDSGTGGVRVRLLDRPVPFPAPAAARPRRLQLLPNVPPHPLLVLQEHHPLRHGTLVRPSVRPSVLLSRLSVLLLFDRYCVGREKCKY